MSLTQLQREDKAALAVHRLGALLDSDIKSDWGALSAKEVTEFRQFGVAILELWDAMQG